MSTEQPDTQQDAFARIERSAERIEQKFQSASDAIRNLISVRDRAQDDLKQQRGLLAGRVRRLGSTLQQTSEQMTRDDHLAQELLGGLGERLRHWAGYIETARGEDVANDLRNLARREPTLFFGGAFLVGLALGRFAKSSSGSARETLVVENKS